MAIDQNLQNILDAATAKANAAGNTQESAAIQLLENAINGSPELAAQLNATADSGDFVAINWIDNSLTSEAGPDPSGVGEDINIGSNYFLTVTNPTQAAQLLGHENYHITQESTVNADYQAFLKDVAAYSSGSSSKSADDIIKEYELFNNQNEGGANITGINDAINEYELANHLSSLSASDINNLLAADPGIDLVFNSDDSLKSGFVQDANGDGLLNFSQSLGTATADAGTTVSSGGASGINDNNEYYAAFAISDLSSKIGQGQTISLDYAGDGLLYNTLSPNTPLTDVQADNLLLAAYANNGNPAPHPFGDSTGIAATIYDSSTGATTVIQNGSSQSSASYLITVDAPAQNTGDPSVYTTENVTTNGTVVNSNAVTTASDGSVSAVITGTGVVFNINNASVTLTAGAQATVNGNNDNFMLTDNSASSLTVSGQGETINTAGNTIIINGNGSSVTLTDTNGPVSNTIQMNGNNQTLNATKAYGSTVTAASGSTGETISGSGMTVNAGTGSQFALNGMSFTFNGGANTQLNIAGGFNTATLGDGSQVTLSAPTTTGGFVGLNTINESNGTVVVAFNDSTYGADTLNGSGNTITSASGAFDINGNSNVFTGSGLGSYFGITGDNNTFNNSSGGGVYLLRGSNNTIASGNGGTFEIYSGTDNKLSASGATVELLAMGTTTINGSNDTVDLDSTGDDTLNVSGSGNTIDAVEGGQLNLLSGSNFDVYIENGTINVGANVSATLELDDDQITASNGDSFQLANGNNTFTAAAGSTVTFSDQEQDLPGDSITITQGAIVLGDKTEFTINGDTNAISGGDQDVIILKGSDDLVNGTNDTITFNGSLDGGDNSLSISGTGNKLTATNATIAFIDGQAGDTLQITGVGDTISATDKSIDFYTNSGNATVTGAGDTLSGSGKTLTLSGSSMTDATVLGLTNSTISADVGNFVISGYGDTFTGVAGSQLNVTDSGNVINISNATITVADDISLTIVGSNDQIQGGDGDGLTITGTNDVVTATNSSVYFGSNNAGDTVTGAGDGGSNWSAPDPDLPAGDNGGYTPPNNSTASVALHSQSHSKYAMGSEIVSQENGRIAPPDINSLVHAMAAFHAEGNGMAVDSLLTSSSPTEHLHLAAAA